MFYLLIFLVSQVSRMAFDWIKMRAELWTHPRFLSLCQSTIYDEGRPGLHIYVCGEENLGIGAMPQIARSPVKEALRIVTGAALRDVTMSALLRVWCSVNAHAKVVGNDAVMSPMCLLDVDVVAGFDGFSSALVDAGWLLEANPEALVFPNFLEFNEPSCCRSNPMTGAERAAKHRAKKKAERGVVTKSNKSNRSNERVEKSREELKNPPTPKGVALREKKKSDPWSLAKAHLSDGSPLDVDRFRAAWSDWVEYRGRAKLKPTSVKRQIAKLERYGLEGAIVSVNRSIENTWAGLFDPNGPPGANGPKPRAQSDADFERHLREGAPPEKS